ncbi:MAG: tRNA (adenosine(37)-N6)-threonylcarbamoyltransferase complex dimerization subunit type 1 TsaB, partial [Lentisphaerae bacterium]|nr:tRNA (adenosine(37)-N6)-threonylcarbamoyltransferase complex dimerization subunit type 1 TsaB [Lentisphaerota bacterium]
MIILALECSTRLAGAAVLRDREVLASATWTDAPTERQQLFQAIPRLLAEASVTFPQIDVYAVGLGPGAFSGLRMALAAAQA